MFNTKDTHYERMMKTELGPFFASCIDGMYRGDVRGRFALSQLCDKLNEGMASHMVDLIRFLGAFEGNGTQTFEVRENVAKGLVATTVDVLDGANRAPFSCYYIDLRRASMGWQIDGGPTGKHPVEGLYVCDLEELSEEHRRVFNTSDDAMVCFVIGSPVVGRFHGDDLTESEREIADSTDDATFRFAFPKGVKFRDFLAEKMASVARGDARMYKTEEEIEPPDTQTIVEIATLVVNLQMYLCATNAEIVKVSDGADKARLEKLMDDLKNTRPDHPRHAKIAAKLQKQRSLINVTQVAPKLEAFIAESGEETGITHRRHLIRGHFQRYHVGKGRRGVEWRWKSPFWKGDETKLSMLRAKYDVK